MPTSNLQFEMERRIIVFTPDTTMPDNSQLGYDGDPNLVNPDSSAGQFLIYNCPVPSFYRWKSEDKIYYKKSTPNNWAEVGSGSGGDAIVGLQPPTPLTVPTDFNQMYVDYSMVETKHNAVNWIFIVNKNEWYPLSCCNKAYYVYENVSVVDKVELFIIGKKIEEVSAIHDKQILHSIKRHSENIDISESIDIDQSKAFDEDIETTCLTSLNNTKAVSSQVDLVEEQVKILKYNSLKSNISIEENLRFYKGKYVKCDIIIEEEVTLHLDSPGAINGYAINGNEIN